MSIASTLWLAVRSVAMTLLIPGAVAGYFPYLILRPVHWPPLGGWTAVHFAAAGSFAVGLSILLTCIWHFAWFGRGTLAPFDEPRTLVVQGLYRYVRNPMYLGVLVILLAESLFFTSTALLSYSTIMFLVWNVFIVLVEEPRLSRKHGAAYEDYSRAVSRWLPGRRYQGPDRRE